jgi:hypothetical protein
MLELAILHKDILMQKLAKAALQPENFYLFLNGYPDFELDLKEDMWSRMQLVSVCNGDVTGYFNAHINRTPRYVSQIASINLDNKPFVFGKDLATFIDLLLNQYKFDKICFSVAVGNPAEKMYDKAIKKLNGRVVGTFKNHYQTPDGKNHDGKWYEIINKEIDEDQESESE